jgi:hypothetical protein
VAFLFGGDKDSDEDGVLNKEDECPETPDLSAFNGCPNITEDEIKRL